MKDPDKLRREAEESPLAWFITLERARTKHNHKRAAEAMKQLRRLGVTVRFGSKEAGHAH